MNLNGICKYESGASFLKSLDSSIVQLLPATWTKTGMIRRGLAQPLLEEDTHDS